MPVDTARHELLILAMRTLRYAGETLQRGDEGGQFVPESRLMVMPAAWHHGCYATLLAELAHLRRMGKVTHWHLTQRYAYAEHATKTLANHAGHYYTVEPKTIDGQRVWHLGERVSGSMEVLRAVAQPKEIVRAPGKRATVVRAIVERWDPKVKPHIVERGLDVLSFLMPRDIALPREVLEASPFVARWKVAA